MISRALKVPKTLTTPRLDFLRIFLVYSKVSLTVHIIYHQIAYLISWKCFVCCMRFFKFSKSIFSVTLYYDIGTCLLVKLMQRMLPKCCIGFIYLKVKVNLIFNTGINFQWFKTSFNCGSIISNSK